MTPLKYRKYSSADLESIVVWIVLIRAAGDSYSNLFWSGIKAACISNSVLIVQVSGRGSGVM